MYDATNVVIFCIFFDCLYFHLGVKCKSAICAQCRIWKNMRIRFTLFYFGYSGSYTSDNLALMGNTKHEMFKCRLYLNCQNVCCVIHLFIYWE